MTDERNEDLSNRLADAARTGRPGPAAGLGERMVAAGQRRRRNQRLGQGGTAGVVLIAAAVAIANLGPGGPGTPTVTSSTGDASQPNEIVTLPADDQADPDVTVTINPVDPAPSVSGAPGSSPSGQPTPLPSDNVPPLPPPVGSEPSPRATPTSPPDKPGASDVGITKDAISIAVVADRSGAVPGLGDPAIHAVEAYFAYVAQEMGPINGRTLELEFRDASLDPGATRQQYQKACGTNFAVVALVFGDASAAGSSAARQCEMPDLRGVVLNDTDLASRWTWAVEADHALDPSLAPWRHWAKVAPDAIERAAWIRAEGSSGERHAREVQEASAQELGYDWVIDHPYGPSETGWSAIVQLLIADDIELVHFDGSGTDFARFQQLMEQARFTPELVTVSERLLQVLTDAGDRDEFEGVQGWTDDVPMAELESTVGGRRYVKWLAKVHPSAEPDRVGMYAWSAAELLVDSIRALGANPTRVDMRDHLDLVKGFTASGLLGKRGVAVSGGSDCVAILVSTDGTFRRSDGLAPGRFSC